MAAASLLPWRSRLGAARRRDIAHDSVTHEKRRARIAVHLRERPEARPAGPAAGVKNSSVKWLPSLLNAAASHRRLMSRKRQADTVQPA